MKNINVIINLKNENLYVREKNGMPSLKIEVEMSGNENKRHKNFYMSPFRGYGFQISGTEEGSGDYGSSKIIGLGNALATEINNDKTQYGLDSFYASNVRYDDGEFAKEIFEAFANTAFNQFLDRCMNSLNVKCYLGYEYNDDVVSMVRIEKDPYHEFCIGDSIFSGFAAACVGWVAKETHQEVYKKYTDLYERLPRK